jgi:hypothetical protein
MVARVPLLAGLALLAVAVGVGSALIADGIRDRGRTDVITVTGSAKRRIASDYVVWRSSVSAQDVSPGPAAAQVRRWTARVRAFFSAHGVPRRELTVEPVATETPGEVSEDTGETTDQYRLTRTFEVRSTRVQAVTDLAEASATLLAAGVPLAAEAPQYVYTKLPSLRPKLIRAAIRDAQRRAHVLVDATGTHLGKVRGVDVGVFQVTPPNSTEVSDYGAYDTSTRAKDVTGVVNVKFALG